MPVGRLFRLLFVPTITGFIFNAMLNLADGMFVGHGIVFDPKPVGRRVLLYRSKGYHVFLYTYRTEFEIGGKIVESRITGIRRGIAHNVFKSREKKR